MACSRSVNILTTRVSAIHGIFAIFGGAKGQR
jgi:hypothetical protein